jgi:site-specific DNA-methyltransferase (adenine-specific)
MSLLILGDAHDTLTLMPSESVDTVVTSPPYFGQRDYGVVGQIGREETIQEYLERLWAVFDVVKEKLKPEGTLFVNLGDKYLNGCLQLIPHQFATEMKDRDWIVLNDITWHKTNCKPESVQSRFGCDAEAIFVFAKSKKHYFNKQYQPYSPKTIERCRQFLERKEKFDPSRHKQDKDSPNQAPMLVLERIAKNLIIPGQRTHSMHTARVNGDNRDVFDSRGRGVRSVWSMPTAQYRRAHFATWPCKLVRRMILAGCPPGGTVVDPFVGSGTTLEVAEELGCAGIGIDLNPEYLEMARDRILEARERRAAARTKLLNSRPRRGRQKGEKDGHLPAEAGQSFTFNHIPEIFEDI